MALGYIVLTTVYYSNTFNGRDIKWMSTNLFGMDGEVYNQTAILTADNKLDPTKLSDVGLPRYTATYVVSQVRALLNSRRERCVSSTMLIFSAGQLCYNLSLGASIAHIFLWNWHDLKKGDLFISVTLTTWLTGFSSFRGV